MATADHTEPRVHRRSPKCIMSPGRYGSVGDLRDGCVPGSEVRP